MRGGLRESKREVRPGFLSFFCRIQFSDLNWTKRGVELSGMRRHQVLADNLGLKMGKTSGYHPHVYIIKRGWYQMSVSTSSFVSSLLSFHESFFPRAEKGNCPWYRSNMCSPFSTLSSVLFSYAKQVEMKMEKVKKSKPQTSEKKVGSTLKRRRREGRRLRWRREEKRRERNRGNDFPSSLIKCVKETHSERRSIFCLLGPFFSSSLLIPSAFSFEFSGLN